MALRSTRRYGEPYWDEETVYAFMLEEIETPIHASISNHFNAARSLSSRALFKQNRAAALTEWRDLGVA